MSLREHPVHHHGAHRPLCSKTLNAILASILHGTLLFSVRLDSDALEIQRLTLDEGLDITFCGLFLSLSCFVAKLINSGMQ